MFSCYQPSLLFFISFYDPEPSSSCFAVSHYADNVSIDKKNPLVTPLLPLAPNPLLPPISPSFPLLPLTFKREPLCRLVVGWCQTVVSIPIGCIQCSKPCGHQQRFHSWWHCVYFLKTGIDISSWLLNINHVNCYLFVLSLNCSFDSP